MTHELTLRVYYEDTDLAGIVYYANYLKYIERSRTEWIRDLGIDQTRLRAEAGVVFAVRKVTADYLRPAHFDDILLATTRPLSVSGARIVLAQEVLRGTTPLFAAEVTLVCLTASGQPTRLPDAVRKLLPPVGAG